MNLKDEFTVDKLKLSLRNVGWRLLAFVLTVLGICAVHVIKDHFREQRTQARVQALHLDTDPLKPGEQRCTSDGWCVQAPQQ